MNDSFICMTWLIHLCDITQLYDSIICSRDSLIRRKWLIYLQIESRHHTSKVMSHIWMSHVYTRMSHVTHMSNSRLHINESCHTCEWVTTAYLHIIESYNWVMSRKWISHVLHINGWYHANERVMSTNEWVSLHECVGHVFIWMSQYDWVMSAYEWIASTHAYRATSRCTCLRYTRWMSHVTQINVSGLHMNESYHSYEWVISTLTDSHVWHDLFVCRHDAFICAWHTSVVCRHDSFICVTWLIHVQTWLTPMCDTTHLRVEVAHSYAWHASILCRHDSHIYTAVKLIFI